MLEELQKLLNPRDIAFYPVDKKVMCYRHVVDLSTGRIIQALARGKPQSEDWTASRGAVSTFEDALARNPISHARAVVKTIRGSGMRRHAFQEVIKMGNLQGWFKNGEKMIQLSELQLLRDVPTRWDSEFHMLRRLRVLPPVSFLNVHPY